MPGRDPGTTAFKRCARVARDSLATRSGHALDARRGLLLRLFAFPALRLAAAVAALVLAAAMVAGTIRILPLLLAPGVPIQLAPVLARGVLAVSLETALFVAPPLGFALAAARLVDRGEARALFAQGLSPFRLVASAWPTALAALACAALAAAAWGRDASAPGRLVGDLVVASREACQSARSPAAANVPMLGISWICLPGEPPRAVGEAPLGATAKGRAPAFAARTLQVSDDLRALHLEDLRLILPATSPEAGPIHLHVGSATLRGIAPLTRASNLSIWSRALLLGFSAAAMAVTAGALVFVASIRSRVLALALGTLGALGALSTFSNLESTTSPSSSYALVPFVGVGGMILAAWLARRLGQGLSH